MTQIISTKKQEILEHLQHVEEDRKAGVPELTLAELESRLDALFIFGRAPQKNFAFSPKTVRKNPASND